MPDTPERARRFSTPLVVGGAVALAALVIALIVFVIASPSGPPTKDVAPNVGHQAVVADSSDGSLEFGGTGPSLWAVTTMGNLDLSSDGGSSWHQSTTPVSLSSLHEPEFSVGTLGITVWLVAPNSGVDYLYRSSNDGQTWTQGVAIPTAAPGHPLLKTVQGSNSVYADLVTAELGYVAVDHFYQATDAQSTLDQSTNGGSSFSATSLPNFGTISFENSTDGFLVGGGGDQFAYATDNAGQSWTDIVLKPSIDAEWTVATPVEISGTTFVIPVTATPTGQTASLSLMGWNFSSMANPAAAATRLPNTTATSAATSTAVGAPLKFGATGKALVAASGRKLTVVESSEGQSAVLHSDDSGQAWASTSSQGLPAGWEVSSLVMTGPTSAVVGVSHNTCVDKNACTYESALYSTANGGASWNRVQP